MMFHASVESPGRAAEALAELRAGGGTAFERRDRSWMVAGPQPVILHPRSNLAPQGITQLPLATPHSIERIVEIACALGFHAEETGGLVEFWIDEYCLFLLVPAADAVEGLRLAA